MLVSLFARAFNARIGRTIGLFGFVAGMTQYKSVNNRPILNRWSLSFFVVLALVAVAAGCSVLVGWRASRAQNSVTTEQALSDAGLAAWGLAYFISAIDDPQQGGRLLDANFFGSIVPSAVTLEWLAMILLMSALLVWVSRSKAKAWPNTLLSATAVAFTLLLAEGSSRLWTLTSGSSHIGYAVRVWQRRFVLRNREGARDLDHALKPGPGQRRLLVIGDSFAFGWGVQRIEDRFGEQLAIRLARNDGAWESLNVSEPDRHTLQEFEFLKRGLRFHPDLVVLLYVFNDMDYLADITPRPMVAKSPKSIADRLNPLRLVFTNSYLFQELYARTHATSQQSQLRAYDDSALVRRHLADLTRFVAIADGAGAAMAIVPIDMGTSIDTATLRRYEGFVRAGKAAGLPFISISHAFDGFPIASITVGSLDGHPNARAYHIAAAAAAPELINRWKEHLTAPLTRVTQRQ